MTLLYKSPLFLEHETGGHPESPSRLVRVLEHLDAQNLTRRCQVALPSVARLATLTQVHSEEYLQSVAEYAKSGGGRFEADTLVSPRSFEVASAAAGTVADAVTRVVSGESRNALCLVRPPGHHALARSAMGFCLFNNIAIGAKVATVQHELDRVLIVDWDVHHGNGTQDIFWIDPQVAFYSIHRFPFYPGTGSESETGAAAGAGLTWNRPISFGSSRQAYLNQFRADLDQFAARVQPQLILLSAGFDAHREDPIGSLGLEEEDFVSMSQFLLQLAASYCGGKLVSVLEGGYNPERLAECVAAHLRELTVSADQR